MNYIKDIARLLEENYTSVPENAAAFEDLIERRKALIELQKIKTPNVPAGMPNGASGINAAIKEINDSIRDLMNKDSQGYRWE
jgi:hypothetical protein